MEHHLNGTTENFTLFSLPQKCIIIIGAGIAAIACVLNILALVIFIYYKSSSVNSGIRLLTFIEILLTASRIVADSLLLTNPTGPAFPFAFTITSTLLCLRNWWIAVITICRCVAIFTPFKANQILTLKRQKIGLIGVLLPSILLNVLRHIWFFNRASSAQDIPVFVFQVALPVPLVLTTSMTMVFYLIGKSNRLLPYAMRNLRRGATRTVLELAIVFAGLQTPGLIHTISIHLGQSPDPLWDTVCNLFSAIDSSANFIIFLINSRNFQQGLCSFFCKRTIHATGEASSFHARSRSCSAAEYGAQKSVTVTSSPVKNCGYLTVATAKRRQPLALTTSV